MRGVRGLSVMHGIGRWDGDGDGNGNGDGVRNLGVVYGKSVCISH